MDWTLAPASPSILRIHPVLLGLRPRTTPPPEPPTTVWLHPLLLSLKKLERLRAVEIVVLLKLWTAPKTAR